MGVSPDADAVTVVLDRLHSVLQRGFTDRVRLIVVRPCHSASSSDGAAAVSVGDISTLRVVVGLLLDPENSIRLLDQGLVLLSHCPRALLMIFLILY